MKLCSLQFEGSVPLPARSVSRDLLSQSVKSHLDEKFHCGEQTHSRPTTRQRNMQHKSRDMSPPYSPSSLYFQRSPGSQPKQFFIVFLSFLLCRYLATSEFSLRQLYSLRGNRISTILCRQMLMKYLFSMQTDRFSRNTNKSNGK